MSNKLLKTSEFGIIDIVVALMHTVESFVEKSGAEKKQYVIDQMKILLDDTEYKQYEEMVLAIVTRLV